jgi:hypothetical protein
MFTETLQNLALNVKSLGLVDGQVVDDSSLSCDGIAIGLSNLSDLSNCLSNKIQTSFSGSLEIGPELEIGSTTPGITAQAGVGPLLGMALDGSGNADACVAPIDANYDIALAGSIHQTGEAILPAPLQLLGDSSACPFGTAQASSNDGTLTATAGGGSGQLNVAQDAVDPVSTPGPNNTGGYFGVQAISDPFTSVTVTDCNLAGGNAAYWWDGTGWVTVSDAVLGTGTPPCLSFDVTRSSTPNLSDLPNALFSVGTNALAVSTASVPGATVGSLYPGTVLSALGGTAPYSWSVASGSLPPGLSLDASSGTISGTPTTGGTYGFTVGVSDSEQTPVTMTKDLSITVDPASTTTDLGVSASSVGTGQAETYTATVTSPVVAGGTLDFFDNGAAISSCQNVRPSRSAPYVATCTVSYDSAGPHSIITSYSGDTSTENSTSKPVSITVANVTGSPTTSVLLPTAGAALLGDTWLNASAASQHPITKVQFEISGGSITNQVIGTGTPTVYGYISGFDSSNFPNGSYTIRSVATDSQGLSASSAPVSITIANVPLRTSVIVPAAGATVRDGSVLDATATGLSPIKSVTFELSGNGLIDRVVGTASLTLYGWIAKVDLTGFASGTYTLQSVATDATESPATSVGVSVSVVNAP